MKERESERLEENENEKWGKSTSRELKKEKKPIANGMAVKWSNSKNVNRLHL